MAHELSFDSNGNAEAMFALKPAWHNLGTVLDHVPNSEVLIYFAHYFLKSFHFADYVVDSLFPIL